MTVSAVLVPSGDSFAPAAIFRNDQEEVRSTSEISERGGIAHASIPISKEAPKLSVSFAALKKKIEEANQKMLQERKEVLLKRFEEWKKDLSPKAPFCLSYVPGLGGLDDFIDRETNGCIDSAIELVTRANSLQKLARVEEKTLVVIKNGKEFVDASTYKKLVEAETILKEERAFLGKISEKKKSDNTEKKFPKVEGTPQFAEQKKDLRARVVKWKEEFVPTPTMLLSKIGQIAQIVEEKTNTIFKEFTKELSYAADGKDLALRIERFSARMEGFQLFLSADSCGKFKKVLKILSDFKEKLL